MKPAMSRLWGTARFVWNLPATAAGCLVGVATGGSCRWDAEHVAVLCTGSSAPKLGSTAFAVGSAVITSLSAEEFRGRHGGRLMAHETKHSDQWALLGPVVFLAAYGEEFIRSRWRSRRRGGDPGSYNLFERWAVLADGGYPPRPPRQ
jgi:hypothetical protein